MSSSLSDELANRGWRTVNSWIRLSVMLVVGLVVGIVAGVLTMPALAPLLGWAAATVIFNLWVWLAIGRMNASQTAAHATREDPSRAATDLLVLTATVVSLGAVGLVLVAASTAKGAEAAILAGLTILSVALSWFLIHTVFTLRYAMLYYIGPDGGVDFNQEDLPCYSDFAYLAFTIG